MQILISLKSKLKTIWLTLDQYESKDCRWSTEIVIVTTALSSVHYVWHIISFCGSMTFNYCWCYCFRRGVLYAFCLFALYNCLITIMGSQHWWPVTFLAAVHNLKLFVIYVNFHCSLWKIHSSSSFSSSRHRSKSNSWFSVPSDNLPVMLGTFGNVPALLLTGSSLFIVIVFEFFGVFIVSIIVTWIVLIYYLIESSTTKPADGRYVLVRKKLKWNDAVLHCQKLDKNAHLVVIRNDEEQKAVTQYLRKKRGQQLSCIIVCTRNLISTWLSVSLDKCKILQFIMLKGVMYWVVLVR